MTEKILVILLSCIYLGSFITRNIMVESQVKQSIRSSDRLLKVSTSFASLCIITTILSTCSDYIYHQLGVISILKNPPISYVGISLFAMSIIIGWFVSAQLKESWRVGVPENQKTKLIQSGIYKFVRNPYFISYYIMFSSLFLIRPSLVMLLLTIATIAVFHRMVKKEEVYLLSVHGEEYEKYKNNTGRYIPHFLKRA